LLTLKPIRDRNVDAEDRAAATMPARSVAPRNGGTRFCAAHSITVSEGWISAFARLMKAAGAVDEDLHADDREAGVDRGAQHHVLVASP
jgi:hypothetical protein